MVLSNPEMRADVISKYLKFIHRRIIFLVGLFQRIKWKVENRENKYHHNKDCNIASLSSVIDKLGKTIILL